MIPWIESHIIQLGPLHLQTWGTFVAAGFLIATWIAARRAQKRGFQSKYIWDMAFWIFVTAMIGSRVFHVAVYEPAYYLAHPFEAIDPRQPGFAIMGGILAGGATFLWYARRKALDIVAYADSVAWGLPWGCGIGRIGCFLIHDHPGTLTSFIGGVKYPDGQVRHDLGLYLSVLGFSIGIIFLILRSLSVISKHQQKLRNLPRVGTTEGRFLALLEMTDGPGFWVAAFFLLDSIARFFLDFLRVIDRRYAGLTPTQWILIPIVGMAICFLFNKKQSLK